MGGFPHSEICGSKVAHTSPQLIAACHVLHRLYAPRHPRIALTSRLRVHTTNDNVGHSSRNTNSAEQRCRLPSPSSTRVKRAAERLSWCGCLISARFGRSLCRGGHHDEAAGEKNRSGAREPSCDAPLVRTDTFTASILRTHSQCQRWKR